MTTFGWSNYLFWRERDFAAELERCHPAVAPLANGCCRKVW